MMKIISTAFTVALLALTSPVLAGTYYKWVDAQGTTHYDVKAPPANVDSKAVRTYNSASSDQPDELERLDRQRANRDRADARAEKKVDQAEQARQQPDKTKADRCHQLHQNLDVLTNRPIVRIKNRETGKMEVIDQEKRKHMLAETRDALALCDKNVDQP